jgi:hypothetical protein
MGQMRNPSDKERTLDSQEDRYDGQNQLDPLRKLSYINILSLGTSLGWISLHGIGFLHDDEDTVRLLLNGRAARAFSLNSL